MAYKEVKELSEARKNGQEDIKQTLQYAETLEGSVRHTGLHACGIIISGNELTEHIPFAPQRIQTCWSPSTTAIMLKVSAC
jgi:DNA polymerase III subunit alpha